MSAEETQPSTMTTTWLDDYLTTLDIRDAHEKANEATINAYTKLADRTAALEEAARLIALRAPQATALSPSASAIPNPSAKTTKTPIIQAPADDTLSSLRADLTNAQRTTSVLTSRLSILTAELAALKTSSTSTEKALAARTREKTALERKLKDRDAELKGKAQLIEEVQDEMVGMEMAVNVAEERAKKLGGENRELVERWMRRVGREAEDMNVGSGWR